MNSIPEFMLASVQQEGGVAKITKIPVPAIGDNNILVKTRVAALNPTDWKHIKYLSKPGAIHGCDFAGEIVQIGTKLNSKVSWKVGDRVSGLVSGSRVPDRGAFAEYIKVDADLVWKLPDDMAYEDAATMGVGLWTSVQALFSPTRLGLSELAPAQVPSNTWIFIYGGGTCCGHYSIQLAHLSGYKVATVASPRSHDFIRSLGADAVFDYRDPDVVSKLKQASGDSIHLAFCTWDENGSQELTVNVLAPGPGKVIILHPVSEEAQSLRPDVTIQTTYLYSVCGVAWTLLGTSFPAAPEDRLQISNFIVDRVRGLVDDGKIKTMKVLRWGGLNNIYDAIQYMLDGKVVSEKIIFVL